ncbi:alpha/beta hydrolase [Leeuwenhoekiella sp. MAR_2009_132]|uniref:alpha/beta hydrolase n=1 Tax=Leeuwenhoekiella sp. MAR_2009_132 TaxID=1392489 RepID=UPI00055F5D81|nr:alpha/beta hydrolase [Leeuwenhoekiella sp. MAR_2009_132]
MIHIYLMPGMAANPSIFEYIKLPESDYKLHPLTWKIPNVNDSLEDYAKKMLLEVREKNPVFIGVSFGGVVVQEMAKYIKYKKVIIISSVKSKTELPRRMRFSRALGLYHLAPFKLVRNIDTLSNYAVGDRLKHKVALYKKYLSITNPIYLNWALKQMLCWEQTEFLEDLVHIHGTEDPVFPYKYIDKCIPVKGGTHVMIISKCKWFNKNLPKIIGN